MRGKASAGGEKFRLVNTVTAPDAEFTMLKVVSSACKSRPPERNEIPCPQQVVKFTGPTAVESPVDLSIVTRPSAEALKVRTNSKSVELELRKEMSVTMSPKPCAEPPVKPVSVPAMI